ncbi:HNH endonuclease [Nitrosospira sp. Is2]|uniref:HNH endonuclease n=1 Tax=Nitrosospira sp. Is2 TaxID=3080532 RepID=UPI002952FB6B|nr:HNH endonuclease [Nitrosospira sp. Is2]WON72916.1 HNH endonuclease [Nitrosospira sp. Is2]
MIGFWQTSVSAQNPLQLALIEKCGNDNGFEYVLASAADGVILASACHSSRASVSIENDAYQVHFQSASTTLRAELGRSFPHSGGGADKFTARSEAALAALLRRAASLARSLPSQAATDYQQAVAMELSTLSAGNAGTEVERLVRQRIGQNKFRDAMLDYWGGACAVTGIAIPEVLRASHAKPWAECEADAERLDVFNGFLLSANLDALFDRFLISFDEQRVLVIAPALVGLNLLPLGIAPGMKLRWVNALHQPYLALHRARLQQRLSPVASNLI